MVEASIAANTDEPRDAWPEPTRPRSGLVDGVHRASVFRGPLATGGGVAGNRVGDVTDYQVLEIGGLDDWRSHHGGFRPESSRDGRRVVDHELAMQYIGLTANA